MLFYLPILLLSSLMAMAAPMSSDLVNKRYYPWNPITWTIAPKDIKADTTYTLSWKGGSGDGYEVYYIPQWEGQDNYAAVDIATTTDKSIKWTTPSLDTYPEGTTFILAVSDVTPGQGAVWYDLTGMLSFVQK